MSSYMSSRFELEQERRNRIAAQCAQELANADAAVKQNRARLQAVLQAQRKQQDELTRQEQEARDKASLQMASAGMLRKELTDRVRNMLDTAWSKVAAVEQKGETGALREQLQTMQNSFSMFGATTQLQHRLEEFERRVYEEAQVRSAAASVHVPEIHAVLQDQSKTFVSLQGGEEPATETVRQTPWQRFLERLEVLRQAQAPLGETRAEQLLEQAGQIPAEQQNLFLLRCRDELEEMERTVAEITGAQEQGRARKQQLWEKYLALCLLHEQEPTLSETADAAVLERETSRLYEQYKKEKERQYVTNAMTQVLEQYGIAFDSMEADASHTLHLRYHMDGGAELQVSRSDTGAFEMEFSGVTTGQTASMEDRRQVTEQARSFCSLLPRIGEELRRRGVLFDQVAVQQPNEQTIRIRRKQSRTEYQTGKKAREMPL